MLLLVDLQLSRSQIHIYTVDDGAHQWQRRGGKAPLKGLTEGEGITCKVRRWEVGSRDQVAGGGWDNAKRKVVSRRRQGTPRSC